MGQPAPLHPVLDHIKTILGTIFDGIGGVAGKLQTTTTETSNCETCSMVEGKPNPCSDACKTAKVSSQMQAFFSGVQEDGGMTRSPFNPIFKTLAYYFDWPVYPTRDEGGQQEVRWCKQAEPRLKAPSFKR